MGAMLLLGAMTFGVVGDVELEEVGVRLPESIGKFVFKGRDEFQGKGLGYSVSYSNRMCAVTLYVYDKERNDIPAGKDGKAVKDELGAAVADLEFVAKQGKVKNLVPLEGDPPLPKAALDKFAARGFTFDVEGGGCKSYILIRGQKGNFVKLRVTQFVVDGKTNDAELHEFLESLAGRFDDPKN